MIFFQRRLCVSCLRSAVINNLPFALSYLSVPKRYKSDAGKALEAKKSDSILVEFLDHEENWGKYDLRPLYRPGRSWSANELRLKSNSDLHKLWYVLLKERNMLLTMKEAYSRRAKFFPNPERLDRVKESMDNIELVVHERNNAFLQLETGDDAAPPERRVTSFMGFTYGKQATEHYEPFEVTSEKEYELPYLDDDAHLFQRMWREKDFMKQEIADYDAYFHRVYDIENAKFGRTLRRYYDRVEDLPKTVLRNGPEQTKLVTSQQENTVFDNASLSNINEKPKRQSAN